MRTSLKRTTAAFLRSIIDIKVEEMAAILNCSTFTIHSLESPGIGGKPRLRLSDDLAKRISHETGVSIAWLLAGDLSTPPISQNGRPYTVETFTRHRARKNHPVDKAVDQILIPIYACNCHQRARAIMQSANKKGDFQLARYKFDRALQTLADEFGEDAAMMEANTDDVVAEDLRDLPRCEKMLAKIAEVTRPSSKQSSRSRRRKA